MSIPNLAGIATDDLVEKIKGAGSFSASYINWSRTMHLLRAHAPGWLPELVPNKEGGWMHRAPVGAYLLIQFRHVDGATTPAIPQAIMDNKNNAVAFESVTARDITDTHRRGLCMAAALTFGLAYELWAKVPLESGYADHGKPDPETLKASPSDGAWDGFSEEEAEFLHRVADAAIDIMGDAPADTDAAGALEYLAAQSLESEEKIALNTLFNSKQRSAMKRAHASKPIKTKGAEQNER